MDWHRDLAFLLYDVADLYTTRFEARGSCLSDQASAMSFVC
jgi:hypothetical protein